MKSLYYYLALGCFCLSTVSCEDFLKETNKSGLTADPFFTTKTGVESSLNACYSGARTFYGQEDGFGMTELELICFYVVVIIKQISWLIIRLI